MSSRYKDWFPIAPGPSDMHQPKLVHEGIPMWHIECELCQMRTRSTYSDSLNSREEVWRYWNNMVEDQKQTTHGTAPSHSAGEPPVDEPQD